MIKRGLMFLVLVPYILGIGFDSYTAVDPISCSGLTTFEDSGTYIRDVYVDASASGGDGSQGSPYQTLSQAAASSQPGDIIHMAAGTYTGGLSTTLQGTAANPIQVVGEGVVYLDGGSNCWQCSECKYLVVRNIKCRNGNYNGFNFDDGANYDDPTAAQHIIFDNVEVHNIGSGGNHDNLKLSGLDDFIIMNSHIYDGSNGGSCIDMVGCHNGIIFGNSFENCGSNAIQTKGGSRNITIHGNYINGVVYRALNMGGSTGEEYYRPSISSGLDAEAQYIRATSNIIIDANSAAGFVSCDHCLFANNVVYLPRMWVLRILQELTNVGGTELIRCRNGEFVNNIIYFRSSDISTYANVGSNTMPETFRFANNLWYAVDNPGFSGPSLPTTEINGLVGDPLFVDVQNEDFHLNSGSPAIGAGETGWVNHDFDEVCFNSVDIGAFSASCEDGHQLPCPIQLGICAGANMTCTSGSYTDCTYPGLETTETSCSDTLDNDCDGQADVDDSDCGLCDEADTTSPFGEISVAELAAFIENWRLGTQSIENLMDAIGKWKNGC